MQIKRKTAEAKATVLRRGKDPEEKMERVMKTARCLFVQKGFHKVTIPDIVKASGVSVGAIYSYFPNKEDLARQIHASTLNEFHSQFLRRLDGKTSARERLLSFAYLIYEISENIPDMMQYLLFTKHAEFMEGAAPICFSEPFRLMLQIVAEGMETGELRPGDPMISAISFTGAILRPVELRFLCVLNKSLTEIQGQLFANAWAAISA